MDLILKFPEEETAYIGLFMIDIKYQNKGIGSHIIEEVTEQLKLCGYLKVRLGVDKGNPQSFAFWTKNHWRNGMVVLMEDIRNFTLKVEMAMISLVTSLEVCSVAEETTKDSIEAVSIKEVLALLMDLEVVDSEVDPSDRKVPTHTQISLLVLMKRLRAAIKSFICKIKMVRCSHYRFIYQPELIQEKVSA